MFKKVSKTALFDFFSCTTYVISYIDVYDWVAIVFMHNKREAVGKNIFFVRNDQKERRITCRRCW